MRQQRLDLSIPQHYDYGDWIRHSGVEQASSRLALWLIQGGRIWLRSAEVAGKTHLLEALRREHPHMGIVHIHNNIASSSLQLVEQWVGQLEGKSFWVADVQAGPLHQALGHALFHWLERARDLNRPVLIAWRCAQSELSPPELRSRLNAMEVIEMSAPISDTDRIAVLDSVARSKQWLVPEGALEVMLQFLPRDLEALLMALEHLDEQHAAVSGRKRISRTWVSEQLEKMQRP